MITLSMWASFQTCRCGYHGNNQIPYNYNQSVSSLDEEQCHHTVNNKVENTLQYTSYKLPYLEC